MASRVHTLRCILLSLMAIACVALFTTASDASAGRAVSLNALKSALAEGNTNEASRLCGITRLVGYVVDVRTKDIVLVGEVDPSLPPLSLDDLAIAFRSAWYLYATGTGRVRYYSPPGCSIDPNPNVLRDLQRIHEERTDFNDPVKVKNYTDKWHQVGSRPQNVRVMGVPFDSHFAKVMVDADYYMKRLVNGSISLGIDGFTSLSDMHMKNVEDAFRSGKQPEASQSLNRFWFSPGESTYSEEDGVVMLKSCQVQLLTEEEFLTDRGEVTGYGRPNSFAKEFARGFTTHYAGIAEARPIYKELEGLFRDVAVARLLKDEGVHCAGLDYLLKSYKAIKVPVGRTLPGLTYVRVLKLTIDQGSGPVEVKTWFPSCGGVCMDVKPRRIGGSAKRSRASVTVSSVKHSTGGSSASSKATAAGPQAAKLKKAVLGARKSPKSLSWDFQIPD